MVSSAPSPILASVPAAFSKISDFCRADADGRAVAVVMRLGTSWLRNWEGGRAERAKVSRTKVRISVGEVEGSDKRFRDESMTSRETVPAKESIKAIESGLPSRWAPCNKVTALLKSPSHLFIKAASTPFSSSLPPANLTPSPEHTRNNRSTPDTESTGPKRNLAQRLVSGSMIRLT